MDLQIATLCDFAADYQGKLVITGTFDALGAKEEPITQQQCALAMRFCFTPEDNGEHELKISIIDADGKPLDEKMPIKGAMPVQVPDNLSFMTRPLVINFQGLRFPKAGVYSIDIMVDDELIQRLPLRILKVGDQGQPSA